MVLLPPRLCLDQAHATFDANIFTINLLQRLATHGSCAWSYLSRIADREDTSAAAGLNFDDFLKKQPALSARANEK
jgi:hypothetical protein